MPLYTVSCRQFLNSNQKQCLVNGLTRVHCEVTQAPAQFVQVVFSFGVPLKKGTDFHILGSIRSGRSHQTKQILMKKFHQVFTSLFESNNLFIDTKLIDVPASWVIEDGDIMPEPGEEKDWLNKNR